MSALPRGSLHVSHYDAPLAATNSCNSIWHTTARQIRRSPIDIAAALASLILHLGILAPTVWSARAHSSQTPVQSRPGVQTPTSADRAAMQWIALDSSTEGESSARMATAPALSDSATLLPVSALSAVADPDINIKFDGDSAENSNESANAPGDEAAKSAMYGRYIGQINARIDRAWVRPRSPIDAPEFFCLVQIEQDAAGNVREVTLNQCNGDARWQVSLVHAIQSASPLPAPPDPAVFMRSVQMSFRSAPFGPGAAVEQYEPPAVVR